MKLNRKARSARHQSWLFVLLLVLTWAFVIPGSAVAGMPRCQVGTTIATWKIEYGISGGIAGINRQITLSSTGSMVATDRRTNKRVEQQLPPEQLSQVNDILRRLDLSEPPRTGAGGTGQCADCFQSTLNLTLEDRLYAVESAALETPQYNELVRLLSSMLKQALAQ